ncbi:MAG: hypothetical protein LBQ15_07035 [Clostridium sp.]|jgi:hypothetical protein|nr:hypothetical protein [Clostridium sp.]
MKIAEYHHYYAATLEPLMRAQVERNNSAADRRFVIGMCDSKASIYEEYQNQKTIFRLLYHKPVPKTNDKDQLHRHKVCACMTAAIIKTRPLYVVEGFPDDEAFELSSAPSINEQLAFSAGLSLLRAYVLADDQDGSRREYFTGTDLFVPEAFKHGDGSEQTFDTLMVWSLYDANVLDGLSTPLLADIYFLLDRYHELYCKFRHFRQDTGLSS